MNLGAFLLEFCFFSKEESRKQPWRRIQGWSTWNTISLHSCGTIQTIQVEQS